PNPRSDQHHAAPAVFRMVAADLADAVLFPAQSLRFGQNDPGRDPKPDLQRIHAYLDLRLVRRNRARCRPRHFFAEKLLMVQRISARLWEACPQIPLRFIWTALLLLAFVACRPKQSASLRIDPSLESLVPADTVFIAGANVDAIRDTPVYQKLLN